MTIISIPKSDASKYINTKLGLNIEQFTKGVPEPVTSTYSVMQLSDILTRITSKRVDGTTQGVVNAFAALFNTETYRATETRGVHIQYPLDRTFTLKKFDPTVSGTHLVGTHLYNFDANSNFIAPAVPLLAGGSYGDTTYIYGQPDKRITNETVKFSLYMDGDTTVPINYTLNNVPGMEVPTDSQIAVYSLNDPEVVRDLFTRLPQSAEVYDHIMSAGGYGFTWGRFKWDTHRWDNPKPGGLYPSKFDGISAEIQTNDALPTNHHNGVLNVYKDLVIQDEVSSENAIQLTAGHLLWDGIKIYLAGYCNFLPHTSDDPVNLADTVTADGDDDYTVSLLIDPGTRNLMAPTSVITDTPIALYTDDEAALPVETVLAAATSGVGDAWSFVATEQLYPSLTYLVEKYSAADALIDNGLDTVITITIGTNTIGCANGMTIPTAGEYIKVYGASHAVNSGLSLDAALAGGYYPVFQHPWKLQGLNAVIDFDPNAIDFVAPDGTSLSRVVLPKHLEEVADPGNLLDTYLTELNTDLAAWPLGSYDDAGATTGKLCYTETEDEDGVVTLKLRHSESESYSADEVTWVYDKKEDGLLSTGIPKDSQKYDLGHTILSFEDIGTLTTATLESSAPVCSHADVITLVFKPIDSRGNRMAGLDFKITSDEGVDAAAVYTSRLDGLLFIPLTVPEFHSGQQFVVPTLRHYVGDTLQTAITLSIALYEA
jgi:hypothetical protein